MASTCCRFKNLILTGSPILWSSTEEKENEKRLQVSQFETDPLVAIT